MGSRILWNVSAPMRDGVALHVVVHLPDERLGPRPAILAMTPYGTDGFHARGREFANHGYAAACADVRGRGSSEGSFEPFVNDGRDGYDLVEWVAAQPWCDGRVAMCGGSYGGMTQWFTARERPPHLRTIVPVAPSMVGFDVPSWNGIIGAYWIRWLTLVSGKPRQWEGFGDQSFWYETFARLYRAGAPFAQLDEFAGNTETHFQTWLRHHEPDAYWDRATLSPADYAGLEVPILGVTGLFDGALLPTIRYNEQHLAAGPEQATQHWLVIGPWDHAGTRFPRREVGGLRLGPQALLDVEKLHRTWYAWTMEGGDRPAFLRDKFVYYVVGLDEWRFAAHIGDATSEKRTFFLNAAPGSGGDVFHSGELGEASDSATPATFAYDPRDVRPADALTPANILDVDLFDQRATLNTFGNGLIYHSAPFDEDVVLAGRPEVRLWLSVDVPDTDVHVLLHQVMPDGRVLTLGEDKMRLRYRRSLREPHMMEPGAIEEIVFGRLPFLAHHVQRYSRIRLVVACPNTPHLQKNYNSGRDPRYEGRADARTANVTVYHAAPHASRLVLPLGELHAARRIGTDELRAWLSEPA